MHDVTRSATLATSGGISLYLSRHGETPTQQITIHVAKGVCATETEIETASI